MSDSPQVNAMDVLASYREELAKMTERALIAETLVKIMEKQNLQAEAENLDSQLTGLS